MYGLLSTGTAEATRAGVAIKQAGCQDQLAQAMALLNEGGWL